MVVEYARFLATMNFPATAFSSPPPKCVKVLMTFQLALWIVVIIIDEKNTRTKMDSLNEVSTIDWRW